jgi:protein involved in polysaccharide export with SLBB domain
MNKYLLTITLFIVAGFFADVNGQANAVQTTPSALTSDPTALGSLSKESEKPRTTPEASVEARRIYKMGVKYGRARLFRQAAESFEKAVQLDPDFADAHFGLGHAYFDLGRWQESIQSLEQGLKLNPKDAQAYTMLGEAYVKLRRDKPGSSDVSLPPQEKAYGESVSLNSEKVPVENNVRKPTTPTVDLTRVYRIGAGDVLDIRLGPASSEKSTLFTITPAGLLEHPNFAEPLAVAGLTVEEIAARLEDDLKRRALSEDPKVSVGVRDYVSHAILVSGLVKEPGTKILRREAIPLYVVIADAQPLAEAAHVTLVRHENGEVSDIELSNAQALNRLVRPGDVITLHPPPSQFFYVGGEVKSPGEKQFRRGLTLTQAILAAGGLIGEGKEVRIGRDNGKGFLTVTRYRLKDINSGKVADPPIEPGDRITIVN